MGRVLQRKFNKNLTFMLFVLPVLLPFIIFFIIPFFMGIYYSLFLWDGISSTMKFVGFQNFNDLRADADYFSAMNFTVKYVVLNVIATNILAILLAVVLNHNLRGQKLLRAAFFLPNVISAIIIGFIWRFIFSQVSLSIYDLTGWAFFKTSWLGDPKIALFSMVLVSVWQGIGYIMVIYLAGLQSIDESYIEAANIDGASNWQRFIHITLPLVMPAITVNLFMTTALSFRLFDLNLTLTEGGPGRTTMGLALDVYKEAFQNNMMGYGSAKAFILFIIVAAVTLVQVKMTKSREVQI